MASGRLTWRSAASWGTGESASADVIACCVLSALWLIPLAVIGIHGDFPLNDDFAYAWSTEQLVETGTFERHTWTWTPVISNILIGYGFSEVFGFSYETLRASGVFMGWVGLLGCFALGRQMGLARRWSFLAALVTAFNPIYLNLSYTFMTDVPFTAMTVWSLAFLVRGLRRSSPIALLIGILLASFAILSR